MEAQRNDDGVWFVADPQGRTNPKFLKKVNFALTSLDPAFQRARERCEFEFICSLLRVRGLEDSGWDPFETTQRGIPLMLAASDSLSSPVAQKHLLLWIYLHILEASEPYELFANLIEVAAGGRFRLDWFPARASGVPISAERKIGHLEAAAAAAGIPQCCGSSSRVLAPRAAECDRTR